MFFYVLSLSFKLLLSQEKAQKSWLERHAESLEIDVENNDSEEERVDAFKKKKASSNQLKMLQQVDHAGIYSICFLSSGSMLLV